MTELYNNICDTSGSITTRKFLTSSTPAQERYFNKSLELVNHFHSLLSGEKNLISLCLDLLLVN
jgi:hypothetical protein